MSLSTRKKESESKCNDRSSLSKISEVIIDLLNNFKEIVQKWALRLELRPNRFETVIIRNFRANSHICQLCVAFPQSFRYISAVSRLGRWKKKLIEDTGTLSHSALSNYHTR